MGILQVIVTVFQAIVDWYLKPLKAIIWPYSKWDRDPEDPDVLKEVLSFLDKNQAENGSIENVQEDTSETQLEEESNIENVIDVVKSVNGPEVTLRTINAHFKMDTTSPADVLYPGDWVQVQYLKKSPNGFDVQKYQFLRKKTLDSVCFTYIDSTERKAVINNQILYYYPSNTSFSLSYYQKAQCTAVEHEHGTFSWRAISVRQTNNPCDFLKDNQMFVGDTLEINIPVNQNRIIFLLAENTKKGSIFLDKVDILKKNGLTISPTFDTPRKINRMTRQTLQFTICGSFPGNHIVNVNFVFSKFIIRKSWQINILDETKPDVPIPQTVIPSGYKLRSPYSGRSFKIHTLPSIFLEADLNDDGNSHILEKIKNSYPFINNKVVEESYKKFFHCLLYFEEAQEEQIFKVFEFSSSILASHTGVHFKITLPCDAKTSFLTIGHKVIISEVWERRLSFEGVIRDRTFEEIFVVFSPELRHYHTDGLIYNIKFRPSKSTYSKMHHAIDTVYSEFGPSWLFPTKLEDQSKLNSERKAKKIVFKNENLNSFQKEAVYNSLNSCVQHPYLIFGPPGTGKTVTLVEIVWQLAADPSSRILVAAPTNNSVDVICSKLMDDPLIKDSIVRLASYVHLKSGKLPVHLDKISYLPVGGFSRDLTESDPDIKQMDLSQVIRHRIICGTLCTLANLYMLGMKDDHITHLLIDEGAQTSEPSLLCPVSLLKKTSKVVIVGDHLQLGPVTASKHAEQLGLSISFMERLMGLSAYSRGPIPQQFALDYDPLYVTQLKINYRSESRIVDFISNLFYKGSLIASNMPRVFDEGLSEIVHKAIRTISGQETWANIFFHGSQGATARDPQSLSLSNDEEVVLISQYYSQLCLHGLSEVDIGIITPYTFQVKKLMKFFDEINVIPPKIGSVEEFQGDERKVILLTTVNSHELSVFLECRKRINVALSRSQYATIIVGNAQALMKNSTWKDVIKYCKKNNAVYPPNVVLEIS